MNFFHTALICSTVWATVDGGSSAIFSAIWLLFAIIVWLAEKYSGCNAGV